MKEEKAANSNNTKPEATQKSTKNPKWSTGEKIKTFAVLFFLSMFICIVVFIYGLGTWVERSYKYVNSSSPIAIAQMTGGGLGAVASITVYFLLYGFGELIDNVQSIKKSIENSPQYNGGSTTQTDNVGEILSENGQASCAYKTGKYFCVKCGKAIMSNRDTNSPPICSECKNKLEDG